MPGDPARREATYAELEALPRHVVGEILYGVLHAFPRPRIRHARAASRLGVSLGPAFDRGHPGPGGWILLDEPRRRAVSAVGLLCWFALAGFLSYAGASPEAVFAAVVLVFTHRGHAHAHSHSS